MVGIMTSEMSHDIRRKVKNRPTCLMATSKKNTQAGKNNASNGVLTNTGNFDFFNTNG